MKTFGALLVGLLAVSAPIGQARADWAIFSAAVSCPRGLPPVFSLEAVVETSSPDPGTTLPKPGASLLLAGEHKLQCSFAAKGSLYVHIAVHPAANGECKGGGLVGLHSITLESDDRKSIREIARSLWPSFNRPCVYDGQRTTISIRVELGDDLRVRVETCTAARWGWGTGFTDVRCQRELLAD